MRVLPHWVEDLRGQDVQVRFQDTLMLKHKGSLLNVRWRTKQCAASQNNIEITSELPMCKVACTLQAFTRWS